MRPNRNGYDEFLQWVDEGGDRDVSAEDLDDYRRELERIGFVESTSDFAIPYCVEDQQIFCCIQQVQTLPNQSIPIVYFRYSHETRDEIIPTSVFAVTGPDGGAATFWRCLQCKKEKAVSDK